ncbi:MAG: hypothetical protein U5J83_06955 [Bryobacterales bacterium]|nr:hypothetical protein [Bryobacterales bacterium]
MPSTTEILGRAPQSMKQSLIAATLATLIAGGMVVAYAVLTPTGVAPELDEEVRKQMTTGAVVATVCMFPAFLFAARTILWWRSRGPHPSVPLTLLATLTIFPLMLSLLIVFAG